MKEKKQPSFLSGQEKIQLREQIMQSAHQMRRKKRNTRVIFSAAASLALLIGFSFFFLNHTEPSIEDFVKTAPYIDIKQTDGVTLILGEGPNLNLDEENSKISYSSTGEDVNIGSGKTINQKSIVDNKPIFNTLIVPYGKRTDLQLSDGTIVWLNSGSKLVYPAVFNGASRSVYLEGEAIFDVSHNPNKPFKVISDLQEIEVLGTVFNVSHYPDDEIMNTVLKSGSIQLTYRKGTKKSLKLTPGTLASFNTNTSKVQTKQVNVKDYFSWKDGFLTLNGGSLKDIMTKLSRYYNVEIRIENDALANETFSGNLDLKEDVNKVIQIIKDATDFEVEYDEHIIKITN